MSNRASESSTSKVLAIVTAIVAVVGLVVSAWTAWYATNAASADAREHDRYTSMAECNGQYLLRCDGLVTSIHLAILLAEQHKAVDAPMIEVRTRAAAVAMFLDAEDCGRLKQLVQSLDSPAESAPLQLLHAGKDAIVHRKKADGIAIEIEELLRSLQGKICQPR